jgi:hypothetical protein
MRAVYVGPSVPREQTAVVEANKDRYLSADLGVGRRIQYCEGYPDLGKQLRHVANPYVALAAAGNRTILFRVPVVVG